MSYLTPDLTGTLDNYKIINDKRYIISPNQIVEFYDTVFLDSIEIVLEGTISVPLVKGYDWEAYDVDYNAIGAMMLASPSFDKTLVKSIRMIKPHNSNYKINMSYQKLYPVTSSVALEQTPAKIELTPELIYDLLESVKRHEALLAPIQDIHAINATQAKLLEPDPNKEDPNNFIEEEIFSVNVPGNVAVIHPKYGSFFKDSLTLKYTVTNIPLVEGEDYEVYGLDHAKTKNTSNVTGVYKYILITKAYVGDISISYHAYGGDPSVEDLRTHDQTINNIIYYLTDSNFLNTETLSSAPIISKITNKLNALEEKMRRMSLDGAASYGDVSSGKTLLKKISSEDTELHWYTIASLYKVAGSNTIYTSDVLKINVQTLMSKFSFVAYVNVDLNNETNKLEVTVPSSLYPRGYVPYVDYSKVGEIVRPQFRIIYNESTKETSGIYLQIGLRLINTSHETLCIEDVSGKESCWKLIDDPVNTVNGGDEDDNILLPSENHRWKIGVTDSVASTYLIPLTEGHLTWSGSEQLNRPGGSKEISLEGHLLEDNIDISRIKKVRLNLLEETGTTTNPNGEVISTGNRFPVDINFASGNEDLYGNTAFVYNNDHAYINMSIVKVNGEIVMRLNANIRAGLSSNVLMLRDVVIYT